MLASGVQMTMTASIAKFCLFATSLGELRGISRARNHAGAAPRGQNLRPAGIQERSMRFCLPLASLV